MLVKSIPQVFLFISYIIISKSMLIASIIYGKGLIFTLRTACVNRLPTEPVIPKAHVQGQVCSITVHLASITNKHSTSHCHNRRHVIILSNKSDGHSVGPKEACRSRWVVQSAKDRLCKLEMESMGYNIVFVDYLSRQNSFLFEAML